LSTHVTAGARGTRIFNAIASHSTFHDTAGQPEIEDRRQKLKFLGPKAKKEAEHVEKKRKEAGEQPVLEGREHTEADERATREACDAVDRERMPSHLEDPRAEREGEEELQLQKEWTKQPRCKLRFGEDSGVAALVPALVTAQHIEDIDRITYLKVSNALRLSSMSMLRRASSGAHFPLLTFYYSLCSLVRGSMIVTFLLQFTSICKRSLIIFHHSMHLGSNLGILLTLEEALALLITRRIT